MTHAISTGIDISAKKVDVVVRRGDKASPASVYQQTPAGHRSLARHLVAVAPDHVVLEATGVYYIDLAITLCGAGLPVSVINPKGFHHFAELKLKGAKTDPVDAALLAEYGQVMQPRRWTPPRPAYQQLCSLSRHINHLVGDRAKAKNRLHGLQATRCTPTTLLRDEKLGIRQLDKRIARLRQDANALLAKLPALQATRQCFCAATGFGDVSTLAIVAELCVMPDTLKSNQVSRQAGLDVRHHQSGSSVNRPGRVSKAGNAYLRTALFYPAMSATMHDPITKAYYDKLIARGKKKKQALVAVMRKYLTGLWACYQSGEPFDPARLFDLRQLNIA